MLLYFEINVTIYIKRRTNPSSPKIPQMSPFLVGIYIKNQNEIFLILFFFHNKHQNKVTAGLEVPLLYDQIGQASEIVLYRIYKGWQEKKSSYSLYSQYWLKLQNSQYSDGNEKELSAFSGHSIRDFSQLDNQLGTLQKLLQIFSIQNIHYFSNFKQNGKIKDRTELYTLDQCGWPSIWPSTSLEILSLHSLVGLEWHFQLHIPESRTRPERRKIGYETHQVNVIMKSKHR